MDGDGGGSTGSGGGWWMSLDGGSPQWLPGNWGDPFSIAQTSDSFFFTAGSSQQGVVVRVPK